MDIYQLISQRQSDRAFSPQRIEREVLDRIAGAALLSPSACNSQPWHLIVVDDEEKCAQVSLDRDEHLGIAGSRPHHHRGGMPQFHRTRGRMAQEQAFSTYRLRHTRRQHHPCSHPRGRGELHRGMV